MTNSLLNQQQVIEAAGITHAAVFPGWLTSETASNDVALLLLDRQLQTPSMPLYLSDLSPLNGQTIQAVGFGHTNGWTQTGGGDKRATTLVISKFFQGGFEAVSPSGRQPDTCQGDSGGPAIATINGTEFVTGVVSGGPEGCIGLTDYSSIVDKAGWIAQILGGSNGAATGNSNTSSGSQPASPPSGQDRSNSCQYAHDNMCDEPTYCSVGTDTADCQGGVQGQTPPGGTPPNPPSGTPPSSPPSAQDSANSCVYANDNMCDEPYYCQAGTDTADCQSAGQGQAPPSGSTPGGGQAGADSCTYARNGTCDEPLFCQMGTDTSDCQNTTQGQAPPSGSTPAGGQGGADSCAYARNGVCDEPLFCQMGTDTSDCQNTPQGQAPPSGSTPAGGQAGADSCTFARDGTCDEPFFCQTGTDTSDCQNTPQGQVPPSGSTPGGGQAGADSCTYARNGTCDEPFFCQMGTDTSDCQGASQGQTPTSGGTQPGRSSGSSDPANSCQYAHDNMCDEPTYCLAGTDTADCAATGGRTVTQVTAGQGGFANSCTHAHDGSCDEPFFCQMGTDQADCANAASQGQSSNNSGASNSNSMTNSGGACPYANDGECDEPTYCAYGTDGYDCH